MVSGPGGELTRGALDHRTDATRRWSHVAEPWVAHARRRRRTGRGHVAGGHATTRVHVGARVGRHVAGRAGRWRAHGYSGPWLESGGDNANYSILAPPYLTASFLFISSVWDYVPTHFQYAGDVANAQALDLLANRRSRGPQSTRSSSKHVLQKGHKWSLIERPTSRHAAFREAPDPHQIEVLKMIAIRRLRLNLMKRRYMDSPWPWSSSDGWSSSRDDRDLHRSDGWQWTRIAIWWLRRLVEELYDRGAIKPRSHHNQAAIMLFQRKIRWSILPTSSDGDRWRINRTIDARSWCDRGPIMARSPRDRGWFTIKLRPRSPPTDQAAPTTDHGHQSAPTIASNGLKIGPNFLSKKPCISPLFLKLSIDSWRELSEFKARSRV